MKFIKVSMLVSLVLVGLVNIVSASTQEGKITHLFVRASDGLTYFFLDSAIPNDKPACATHNYWMIKDENSEVGKKQYAMLLAAHSAGRTIKVSGMGTCTRWGDGEDVNSVVLLSN